MAKKASDESLDMAKEVEAAKKGDDEDRLRAAGRDQLYGGRVEVICDVDGLIYDGETYEVGDSIDMNKQDAVDTVRHGGAHFPLGVDEEERETDTEKIRAKKAARRAKKGKK